MPTFTSSGGQSSVQVSGATTPQIQTVSMPLAATEYSVVLPTGCRQFMIRLRGPGKLQVSYSAGMSGTTYIEVPRYCFYAESDLTTGASVTLYFQSPLASQVLEVLTWV